MKISEMFYSAQGEGIRTGVLSAWVRFAACNLSCRGFMQRNPTKPLTYENPLGNIDPKSIKSLDQLPVMKYGCDTLYAIDPRFKHLFQDYTVEEVVQKIHSMVPWSSWKHPVTGNEIDLCITGGEPMLWQDDLVKILEITKPTTVQIETNGTKDLEHNFKQWYIHGSGTLCWNISPKLYNVSGEPDERAWKPEVISNMWALSPYGCLKFVVNGSPESWIELDEKVSYLKRNGVGFPVYVMPVGSTYEHQTNTDVLSEIATHAVNKGYHLSSRLQSIFWKNTSGV